MIKARNPSQPKGCLIGYNTNEPTTFVSKNRFRGRIQDLSPCIPYIVSNTIIFIVNLLKRFASRLSTTYGLDLRSLALFRLGLALVIIYDLTDRILDMSDHYTDDGVLPRNILIEYMFGIWEWSLHLTFGHYFGILILFILAYLAAFSLFIGYKSKWAATISWILMASLQTRNPMILQSGDELLKMLLLWSIFLPMDSFYSVDSPKSNRLRPHFSIASIGFSTQLIIVYVFAGLFKLAERHWLGGEALFLAFGAVDINAHLSRLLLQFHSFLRLSNHLTLFFEIFFPLLLWMPWKNHFWRVALILSYVAFHINIFLTFQVGIFVIVPMAAWLAFLPPCVWNSSLGIKLHAFLIGLASYVQRIFHLSKDKINPLKLKTSTTWALSVLWITVVSWNITTLPGLPFRFPDSLRPFIYGTTLQQAFGMFSVTLPRSGWIWIPGVLNSGDYVDLTIDGGALPLRSQLPLINRQNNPNDRWGKFTECLVANHGSLRLHYGKFLCKKVNQNSPGNRKLDAFKIMFIRYNLKPDGTYAGPIVDELWNHECEQGMGEKWQSQLECLSGGPPCPKK